MPVAATVEAFRTHKGNMGARDNIRTWAPSITQPARTVGAGMWAPARVPPWASLAPWASGAFLASRFPGLLMFLGLLWLLGLFGCLGLFWLLGLLRLFGLFGFLGLLRFFGPFRGLGLWELDDFNALDCLPTFAAKFVSNFFWAVAYYFDHHRIVLLIIYLVSYFSGPKVFQCKAHKELSSKPKNIITLFLD
ncbi:hypothetical protein RJ639_010999 [Escallonia herrerae]|uniref:Uncharacterized protein n=1 Tax=Escallonia herrerae TaxID=1293975 RepID=A0AA89AS02_9ASTE|nr:hypothetical protein RJ639_010999 [Escallonia herrerae]